MASDIGIMERGKPPLHEVLTSMMLGVFAASTYELLYLLPLLCLIVIYVRCRLSGMSGGIFKTRAFSRWAIFTLGFLAIFVPIRIIITMLCWVDKCYEGSSLILAELSPIQWLGRSSSGLPLVYPWINSSAPSINLSDFMRGGGFNSTWLTFALLEAARFRGFWAFRRRCRGSCYKEPAGGEVVVVGEPVGYAS